MNNIYLMSARSGDDIIWKVGVSVDPDRRFREHKVSNPNLIKTNAVFRVDNSEYAYFIESRIKSHLSIFSIGGEWFEPISLNEDLFFVYCERYYEIAKDYFRLKKNLEE